MTRIDETAGKRSLDSVETETGKTKCQHEKQYWNDAGFRMCDDCEAILEFDGTTYAYNKSRGRC